MSKKKLEIAIKANQVFRYPVTINPNALEYFLPNFAKDERIEQKKKTEIFINFLQTILCYLSNIVFNPTPFDSFNSNKAVAPDFLNKYGNENPFIKDLDEVTSIVLNYFKSSGTANTKKSIEDFLKDHPKELLANALYVNTLLKDIEAPATDLNSLLQQINSRFEFIRTQVINPFTAINPNLMNQSYNGFKSVLLDVLEACCMQTLAIEKMNRLRKDFMDKKIVDSKEFKELEILISVSSDLLAKYQNHALKSKKSPSAAKEMHDVVDLLDEKVYSSSVFAVSFFVSKQEKIFQEFFNTIILANFSEINSASKFKQLAKDKYDIEISKEDAGKIYLSFCCSHTVTKVPLNTNKQKAPAPRNLGPINILYPNLAKSLDLSESKIRELVAKITKLKLDIMICALAAENPQEKLDEILKAHKTSLVTKNEQQIQDAEIDDFLPDYEAIEALKSAYDDNLPAAYDLAGLVATENPSNFFACFVFEMVKLEYAKKRVLLKGQQCLSEFSIVLTNMFKLCEITYDFTLPLTFPNLSEVKPGVANRFSRLLVASTRMIIKNSTIGTEYKTRDYVEYRTIEDRIRFS